MLGRLIAMSLATQVVFAGHCAAQAVDPGPVRVGDRWSYNISDDLTGDLRQAVTLVVVEISDKEITTRVSAKGKDRPQTMVFDHDWGRIDDGLFKLRPAGIGIRKPLQIGKEWRSDANAINLQTGHTFRASGAAKVAAQEQMKVPAGTFDTFRVDTTVRLVNTKDQTKSHTYTFVFWYAPAINRWVKRKTEWRFEGRLRDSTSDELTEYLRNPVAGRSPG
jgi:hypothetical protein